jgi:hypothetical protein
MEKVMSLVFLVPAAWPWWSLCIESGGVLSELMELSQRGRWEREAGARVLGVISGGDKIDG